MRYKSNTGGNLAVSPKGDESNHKPKTKREKKTPKKQTRIKGANLYKTPPSHVEINEFPNVVLSKGLIKELSVFRSVW